MKVLKTESDLHQFFSGLRRGRKKIGFVPTMGALHDGHLALIRRCRSECAVTVVSIYVNPIQFDRREDFEIYPRDLEKDLALLKKEKVQGVFTPEDAVMYPPGFSTRVRVEGPLVQGLCAPHRPGHFEGVATVVARLLGLVRPHRLYLGWKDYQQYRVLERMVRDLALPVQVVGCPTVRESDGLACSSRNLRLTPEGRAAAAAIYRALKVGQSMIQLGETSPKVVLEKIREVLREEKDIKIQYVEAVDAETLSPKEALGPGTLLACAVLIDGVRLIDNIVVESGRPEEFFSEKGGKTP